MSVQWGKTPIKKKTPRKRVKLELPTCSPCTPKKRKRSAVGVKPNAHHQLQNTQNVEQAQSEISKQPRVLFGDIIPSKIAYLEGLKLSQRHFQLPSGHVVLAECDKQTGILTSRHMFLRRKLFRSMEDNYQGHIFLCSCEEGIIQETVLIATDSELSEDFLSFYYRETDRHCLHARAAMSIFDLPFEPYQPPSSQVTDEAVVDFCVTPLNDDPLLVAICMDDNVYLIESNQRTKKAACTCVQGSAKHFCAHLRIYNEWCLEQGVATDRSDEATEQRHSQFDCVSSKKIPVPLPAHQQQQYREYEMGMRSFPEHLVPTVCDDQPKCPHGFAWDNGDPVQSSWIVGFATIYKDTCSITHVPAHEDPSELSRIKVYYRPCIGDCRCKLHYDGQEDLLLNLDGRTLLHYDLLFSYLHHMLEGRNPLAACHRAYQRNHAVMSGTSCIPLHKLRLAWNSFARLLDVNWETAFVCSKCGDQPSVFICDGTAIGFRKDLLSSLTCETPMGDVTSGTKHKERVYINHAKTRKLLAQYATGSNPLTEDEFADMVAHFATVAHLIHLKDLVESFDSTRRVAPTHHRQFLKDLSRNGPACAMLQGATSEEITELELLLNSDTPLFLSSWSSKLDEINRTFPLLFDYMKQTLSDHGRVNSIVRRLVCSLLTLGRKTFDITSDNQYQPAPEVEAFKDCGFFPALPKRHRKANYSMNNNNKDPMCRSETDCNKYSHGHPTLSPGIFTLFCPHGICYGFQVMTKHESPEVPFDIFKTRFARAPEVIIYDNACRLHAYCLNREPEFFRNTVFLVDRMHWHGHRSCCRGYSINTYKGRLDLQAINSQVNEQENAGLVRIKGQLAYMLPDNFVFHAALYLSFRNSSKMKRF